MVLSTKALGSPEEIYCLTINSMSETTIQIIPWDLNTLRASARNRRAPRCPNVPGCVSQTGRRPNPWKEVYDTPHQWIKYAWKG